MNKKLTLLLDEKIIARAKHYADENNESLSGMVAKYFMYLTDKASYGLQHTVLPREIEEIIGIVKIPDAIDIKKDYRESRAEKGMHD